LKEMLAKNGPVAELEKMKKEGIIINIGISGGPIDMLLQFVKTGRFDAVITHNRWNLLYQIADPLIETAYNMGMGIVNAAPYASGILVTGANKDSRALYKAPSQKIIKRVNLIEAECKKNNIPLGMAALQFSLNDPRINSTVVGISSPEQIEEILYFSKFTIPDNFWKKINSFAITNQDPEG